MKYILIIIGTIVVLRWLFRVLFRVFMIKLARDMGRQQPGYSGGNFGPFRYSSFNGGAQPPAEEPRTSTKDKGQPAKPEGDYIPYKEVK